MLPTPTLAEAGPVRGNRRRALPSVALAAVALTAACLLGGCGTGEIAARAAASQIGKGYARGGASPRTGFDCSGLTMWAWSVAGKQIPRTASQQYAASYPVLRRKLQLGDLAFYAAGGRISHVAMYAGRQTLIQAHKPGYPVERVRLGWWADHLVGYRRLR